MSLEQSINKSVPVRVAEIMKSNAPAAVKYQRLDALQLKVMEHHPDGLAADVLEVVRKATTEVMTKGGEPKR